VEKERMNLIYDICEAFETLYCELTDTQVSLVQGVPLVQGREGMVKKEIPCGISSHMQRRRSLLSTLSPSSASARCNQVARLVRCCLLTGCLGAIVLQY
jgi:hypothetical protein